MTVETSSAAALRASERQPSNLAGLLTTLVEVKGETVAWQVACACGSRIGKILAGAGGDDFPWLDPLDFKCIVCSSVVNFFDSERDGYNGRRCGGSSYDQDTTRRLVYCSNCRSPDFNLTVKLAYGIDFDDPDESLGEDEIPLASDFFDGLSVDAQCSKCQSIVKVGPWELA